MADFVTVAFRASRALGGPSRLARRLGVEPDELYRWMAGLDQPTGSARRELMERIIYALATRREERPALRRHGDFLSA